MDAFSRRELGEDEDFYVLLGCDETSTVGWRHNGRCTPCFNKTQKFQPEQISTEYKLLAKKYHPDKVSNPEEKDAGWKALKQSV